MEAFAEELVTKAAGEIEEEDGTLTVAHMSVAHPVDTQNTSPDLLLLPARAARRA